MFTKHRFAFVFFTLFIFSLVSNAVGGPGTSTGRNAEDEKKIAKAIQTRAAARLNRLADFLDEQAREAVEDVDPVRDAILDDDSSSGITRTLESTRSASRSIITRRSIDGALPHGTTRGISPKATAGQVVGTIDGKAKTVHDFADHLRGVAVSMEDEDLQEGAAKLDQTYIPADVNEVLAPEVQARITTTASVPRTRSIGNVPNFTGGLSPEDLRWYTLGSPRVAGTGARASINYPSVVAVQQDISDYQTPQFSPWCTGTLIAPNVVLSAAHCFCKYDDSQDYNNANACRAATFTLINGTQKPALDPSYRRIFTQHGGPREIERVDIHDDYEFPTADLALVYLKDPIHEIAPMPINTARKVPIGTTAVIVGFGRHSKLDQLGNPLADAASPDAGLKFFANTITGPCRGTNLICWHFSGGVDQSVRNPGNTCSGDSGGPLFAKIDGNMLLVGVTSGGRLLNCGMGDDSFDVEVYSYKDWINDGLTANAVATASADVRALHPFNDISGRLFFAKSTWQFRQASMFNEWRLRVPGSAERIHIGVNTDRITQAPVRLRLVDEGGATVLKDDGSPLCDVETEHAAASCAPDVKPSPTWRIQASGPGSKWFQIVGSAF